MKRPLEDVDWRQLPRRPFRRAFVAYDVNKSQRWQRLQRPRHVAVEDPAGDVTAPPVATFGEAKLPMWMQEAATEEAWELSAMQAPSSGFKDR